MPSRPVFRWWHGFALALAYMAAGKLGLMLALPPGYVSGVFPAAGLAIGASFLWGPRALPGIFAGSLVLNLWVGSFAVTATALAAAVGIALASTIQSWAGGALLRRALGSDAALDTGTQIARYLLLAPLICTVSATLATACLAAGGLVAGDRILASWFFWWVGHTLGQVTCFPMVLALAGRPAAAWRGRRLLVVATMSAGLALAVGSYIMISRSESRRLDRSATAEVVQMSPSAEPAAEPHRGLLGWWALVTGAGSPGSWEPSCC